jgi:hypothetical protein
MNLERRPTMTINITKPTTRAIVALHLPAKVPALITYAQGIVKAMTGSASFPNPAPTLAVVTAAIADLVSAETAALARTKGAVTTRNEKKTALVVVLQELRTSIQSSADANATNAVSIIQSAGVTVRKTPVRLPQVFSAKPGPVSGVVHVYAALAGRRAGYEWQYSIDGGKTWVMLPTTLQAKTSVTGLVPGSTVQLKYRPVTKTGEGDWSQPISTLVH